MRDPPVRDFFMVCLSLAVRRSSYQRANSWKIHRLREDIRRSFAPDPAGIFLRTCRLNMERMRDLASARPQGRARAVLGDARDLRAGLPACARRTMDGGRAPLVVTSPPYGDHKTTVAYGQFSRHAAYWLGLPAEASSSVDRRGLGGRAPDGDAQALGSAALDRTLRRVHRSDVDLSSGKAPRRAAEVASYFLDLDRCLGQASAILEAGRGRACFVVANRTVRRVVVPTDLILVELGRRHGLVHERTFHRDIPNKVMPARNAPENAAGRTGSTMTREAIIVMRR